MCAFFAIFWDLRLVIQFVFHDRSKRREHGAFDLVFRIAFAYLAIVFTVSALR